MIPRSLHFSTLDSGVTKVVAPRRYWLWTDIKKGTFSKKMSILKGWFIGTAAGVLVSAFIVYNSIRRLGLQSFYIELITGLVLWMLGGILTSWVIAQFIGENLDNQN